MKEETIHIITVGTSLINNDGGQRRPIRGPHGIDSTKYLENVGCLNMIGNDIKSQKGRVSEPDASLVNQFSVLLKKLNLQHEMSISRKEQGKPSNRFSAEITYLFRRFEEIKECANTGKEHVYLLPTNTIESKFCANATRQYIELSSLKNIYSAEVTVLKSMNLDDLEKADRGINNLLEVIHDIISRCQNTKKVYIPITGGIKFPLPYITLQGMLYSPKVVLCYLQPEKGIVPIPFYPIGVDFHHYHQNAKRLKMVLEGHTSYEDNLSEPMRNLIDNNELTILGKQFKQRYQEQLALAPIEIYSKEIVRILLPDELDERAKDYRRILETVIDKSGAYIWIGDKIPEMVEHARRHHHNLLEFAEMFLTPILKVKPTFLNAGERFCLIAGILLHDCGHSIDFIDTEKYGRVPLFASEIRDLHHILAAQRLNDEQLRKDLGWLSKKEFTGKHLKRGVYDAVMNVCIYHRARMPYHSSQRHFANVFAGKYYALELRNQEYNRIGIDIMKITALMRIIDSCDVQSSRSGSEEEVRIALNLLKKDYKALEIRAKNAYGVYEQICKMSKNDSELKDGGRYIDKKAFRLKDNYMKFRVKCVEALKKGLDESKALAGAWLTAAELIDRADMKRKQDRHYKKHQYLREIMVVPSDNFTRDSFQFDIILCPAKEIPSNDKKSIKKELFDEYLAVKDYLNRCNISLRYFWENKKIRSK